MFFPMIGRVGAVPICYQRPDSVEILKDKEAVGRLERYFKILRREAIAKFLVAKMIEVNWDDDAELDDLWKLHDLGVEKQYEILKKKSDRELLLEWERKGPADINLVDLKAEIANRILEECVFCEWRCKVDRTKGQKGVCRLDEKAYIASIFVHIGEESELVPSYTIFFSHCNFKCVFCQNWDISQEHAGRTIPPMVLAETITREWDAFRIRNVNWVGGEPTMNLHYILEVLRYLDASVPIVWNSNLYDSLETMKLLKGLVDVWLPDFKYGNNQCALKYSKVPKYYDTVTRNLKMISNWGEEVIIRHLILPNHVDCCTLPILKWISENMNLDKTRVNLMDQYRPEYRAHEYKELNRRISGGEWRRSLEFAKKIGLSLTL